MHRMYETNDITVFWNSDKCWHSKVCVTGCPEVFEFQRKPWIILENGETSDIWQTIEKCPSKALRIVYNHDVKIVYEPDNNRSVALLNGVKTGECDYEVTPSGWNIYHTEVDPAQGGKGIAKRLVYKLLEAADRAGVQVIPTCSYAKKVADEG